MNHATTHPSYSGKRLTFLPVLDAASGYGIIAQKFISHWHSLGIHVVIRPIRLAEGPNGHVSFQYKKRFVHCDQPEPWEVTLTPCTYRPRANKQTAYFTMYEASHWPNLMVKMLNAAALVLVPCEWNRHGLIESGCTSPVAVVPFGFEQSVFKPAPVSMEGPCVFGAAGRLAHGPVRKGINAVIDAFSKEFLDEDDVVLKVKGFADCPTKASLDRRIQVSEAFLSEPQLADWYRSLTCFVSAARSEGWGLMQLEAMACGRPVIASLYSGLREFMTEENSFPVDYRVVPAGDNWAGVGDWAEPDESHLRWWMRKVYRERDEARKIGDIAAKSVSHLTWENSSFRFLEELSKVGAI